MLSRAFDKSKSLYVGFDLIRQDEGQRLDVTAQLRDHLNWDKTITHSQHDLATLKDSGFWSGRGSNPSPSARHSADCRSPNWPITERRYIYWECKSTGLAYERRGKLALGALWSIKPVSGVTGLCPSSLFNNTSPFPTKNSTSTFRK